MIWLQLLRVHQWPKNGFVLAALLFGQRLSDAASIRSALLAAALFCLASSMVYLLNDLLDREQDRAHPRKCKRPIASGRVQPRSATILLAAGILLLLPLTWFWLPVMLPHVLIYLGLNLFYSTFGKGIPLLDILLVASGFVIRVLAGAAVIAVPASSWLLLCTGALAFFLAAAKRRLDHGHGRGGRLYSMAFLDSLLQVSLTAALIFYGLYCNEHDLSRPDSPSFLWTLPPVIFGMLHYMRRVPLSSSGERDLLLDLPLVLSVLVWLALCVGLLA